MNGVEALEKMLRGEMSREEALRIIAKGIPDHARSMNKMSGVFSKTKLPLLETPEQIDDFLKAQKEANKE